MKCPYCSHLEDKVVDSRESKEGEVIRRRRECLSCGKRFTSYERIDQIPHLEVVPLHERAMCCGGAGTYFARQPERSEEILRRKFEHALNGVNQLL